MLAISKGGSSDEMMQLAEVAVRRGLPVVAITDRLDSPFAHAASSVVCLVTRPVDADPSGLIAMGSTLSVGAWGDTLAVVLMTLAVVLMRLRSYGWQEVLDTHPLGVVGLTRELPAELPPIAGPST